MAIGPTPGERSGTARTTYTIASNILNIMAHNEVGDEATHMKFIYDETNLNRAANAARDSRDEALMEADRHDAILRTVRTMADEKKAEREADEVLHHLRNHVAKEFGYTWEYQHLSGPERGAVDAIIKLRKELTEMSARVEESESGK